MTDMAKENEMSGQNPQNLTVDWYTIFRDIGRQWRTIVLIAAAVFLCTYSFLSLHYHETYRVQTTFTVYAGNTGSVGAYNDNNAAYSVAGRFQALLRQPYFQADVSKAIGKDSFEGASVGARQVKDTNMINMWVDAGSPRLAYQIMEGILQNYQEPAKKTIGDINMNILIQPSVPESPIESFSPWKTVAAVTAGGTAIWILFLGLLSFSRDTVRKVKEVEQKLDTKLLGTLYHEKKHVSKKFRKAAILITNPTVSFSYSESMKRLASKIKAKMDHRNAKTLMITSVLENEGKSTVAANLALALADGGYKVILMEGDFRKPALFKIFEANPDQITDLGEVLHGDGKIENLLHEKENPYMRLIFNTRAYADSSELIVEGLFGRILEVLKKSADYVIIDTSPMALVADAEEIVEYADAAVLVVRQHLALVKDINDAIDSLNREKVKLLGCVFNNVGGEGSAVGGYGGYSHYGHYGSYGSYSHYGHYGHYGNYGRYGHYGAYRNYSRQKGGEDDE